MLVLFWISVAVILYTYFVYPLTIIIWGSLFPRRVEKRYRSCGVSVVIAAKNEARNIEARVQNLLDQDYEPELIEIIVVSDGSTDETSELVRSFDDDRVRLIESESVGKAGALNRGIEAATHDVIVFADARQCFGPNVLAELTAMLYDEAVGGVSGELVIVPEDGSEVGEGVGLYWEYEKLIRRMESEANSVVGATGCIYAIRKELYRPLPPGTLLDDFVVPMRIVLAGSRVLFVRSARAFDTPSATSGQEFARKVRTLAGNFQAITIEPNLMSARKNPVWFQFISHKLTRLIVPYFCLAALVSSGLLSSAFFRTVFIAQIVFYVLGLLNLTPLNKGPQGRLFRVAWTFMVLNAAAVAGTWVFVTGGYRRVWKRSEASR